MSDGLFLGLMIAFGALIVLAIAVGIWIVRDMLKRAAMPIQMIPAPPAAPPVASDPQTQRQEHLLAKARKVCSAKACCNCKHWDMDAGRDVMLKNPTFMLAARHLSPNVMGRKADDSQPKPLPHALDTWELFGACEVEENIRHAIDVCPAFEAPV